MAFILLAWAFTACALVDEDMRDCETDYSISYELKLVTNMTTELQTQLSMAAEAKVASALQTYLKNVFTDTAHDVNLSFYDVYGDSLRLHHESHVMEANQSSYTLYIPVRKYMHLAVANLDQNGQLQMTGDEKCHGASLQQVVRDTIDSYKTGIFTARLPMDIKDGMDQQFDVKLYTATCAHALVLDTLGSHIRDIKVYASGFATGMNLADSVFVYSYTPIVRTDKVEVGGTAGESLCFAAVTFPSRNISDTKVIINSDDEFVSEVADQALWKYRVYTTMPDGSVTETILGVKLPMQAGQMKIIKCTVISDGSVAPTTVYEPYVGASVTLNWNELPAYNVEI